MFTTFKSLLRDESGVTAIEYGLIAALIAVGLVVVLGQVGASLQGLFGTVSTSLQNATATP